MWPSQAFSEQQICCPFFTIGLIMWNLMHFLLKLDGYLLEVWLTGWLGLQDMAEHLTTVYLSHCERGQRCLYEGSTPPGGFPNSWVWCISPTCMLFWWLTKLAWAWILCLCNCWVRYWFMNESMLSLWMVKDFDFDFCCLQNGASSCTSELTLFRNGEIHCWDRAYDDSGNQVSIFTCTSYFGLSAS